MAQTGIELSIVVLSSVLLMWWSRRFTPAPPPAYRPHKILRVAMSLWWSWMSAVWIAMVYFGFNRPTIPVPEARQLYPFNDHGTVVYLTKAEHLLTIDLWAYYMVVAALLMAFEFKQKRGDDTR